MERVLDMETTDATVTRSLDWSDDGERLLAGTSHEVRVYDLAKDKIVASFSHKAEEKEVRRKSIYYQHNTTDPSLSLFLQSFPLVVLLTLCLFPSSFGISSSPVCKPHHKCCDTPEGKELSGKLQNRSASAAQDE